MGEGEAEKAEGADGGAAAGAEGAEVSATGEAEDPGGAGGAKGAEGHASTEVGGAGDGAPVSDAPPTIDDVAANKPPQVEQLDYYVKVEGARFYQPCPFKDLPHGPCYGKYDIVTRRRMPKVEAAPAEGATAEGATAEVSAVTEGDFPSSSPLLGAKGALAEGTIASIPYGPNNGVAPAKGGGCPATTTTAPAAPGGDAAAEGEKAEGADGGAVGAEGATAEGATAEVSAVTGRDFPSSSPGPWPLAPPASSHEAAPMKESKESKEVESLKEVPGKHDVDPAPGDHHDVPSRATVPECFATATVPEEAAPRALLNELFGDTVLPGEAPTTLT